MTARNLFENICTPFNAPRDEIESKIRVLRKTCHPDWIRNHVHEGWDLKSSLRAGDIVRNIIDKSADILLNDAKRKQYVKLVTKTRNLADVHGGVKTPFRLIHALIDTGACGVNRKPKNKRNNKRKTKI